MLYKLLTIQIHLDKKMKMIGDVRKRKVNLINYDVFSTQSVALIDTFKFNRIFIGCDVSS